MTVVFIFIVIVIVVIVKGCDRNLILGRKEEKKKINFSFSETVIAMVKNFFFPPLSLFNSCFLSYTYSRTQYTPSEMWNSHTRTPARQEQPSGHTWSLLSSHLLELLLWQK